ncbi:hypothetical protein [Caldovatus aquaticus]|uniref:Uncharacterized protein n=1 Tax=Caldovatus aquaticus TaxID=2865671 RepID=A0ABS7F6Z8_9PROT|nr:hypothetical protein [Caldovatus aquaticus]MBW8271397.1 hypothetical protein [Caldovatus aquaticus]
MRASAPPPAVVAFPLRDDDRLRLALRRLEAAFEEQGRALAEWRAALGGLGKAMAGLHGSVHRYRAGLAAAAAGLERAREATRALEATADMMRERARHLGGA